MPKIPLETMGLTEEMNMTGSGFLNFHPMPNLPCQALENSNSQDLRFELATPPLFRLGKFLG